MLEGPRTMTVYTKPYWWTRGAWDFFTEQVKNADGNTSFAAPYFRYYTRDRIDCAGIAAEELAIFPQGWSVQEIKPPLATPLTGKLMGEDNGPINQYCEIHDIWSTVEITESEIFTQLFQTDVQIGPAMEGANTTATTANERYLDFEQVIAARSRVWSDDSGLLNKGLGTWPTFNYLRKVHDCTWGSGEPVGSDIVYHVRAVRFFYDTDNQGNPVNDAQVFIPASIQPMLTLVDKPADIAYLAMKQRSLDV